MKVNVRSTFNLNGIQIDTQSLTLGELLNELSNKHDQGGIEFFDTKSGRVSPIYTVFLNGKMYDALAEGLDTRLKDGDEIEIYLTLLTGG